MRQEQAQRSAELAYSASGWFAGWASAKAGMPMLRRPEPGLQHRGQNYRADGSTIFLKLTVQAVLTNDSAVGEITKAAALSRSTQTAPLALANAVVPGLQVSTPCLYPSPPAQG